MTDLSSLLMLLFAAVVEAAENAYGPPLGGVVLLVIGSPVVILLLAAVLGKPREQKITGLFLMWLMGMFTVFIGAVYLLGAVLGLFY